jgi:GNAT superfamily N-acetyltransferase
MTPSCASTSSTRKARSSKARRGLAARDRMAVPGPPARPLLLPCRTVCAPHIRHMGHADATITVRTASPADTAAVDALLGRSYPRLLKADYPPSIIVTALPIISRARPELLGSGTYFVAVDAEGVIVGAGGWTVRRVSPGGMTGRSGDVRHVVTDDRALRRGIGRAIIERVFETARAAGLTSLACLSTRTAVPFYRAQGFCSWGPSPEMVIPLAPGISFPVWPMSRQL